jgi:asparagine synthase (glutamine-hydrolysing)
MELLGRPALVLSPLERATGLAIGEVDHAVDWPPPDGLSARAVLEEILLSALIAGPVAVSFSGGRDSSAVLATATAVARRHGLPLPVPVTLRFPGVASTEESAWQELVVRHLGLREWQRIEIDQELDLLGDLACDALRRHGLMWPPNAYFHAPVFRAAEGGCVLTGFDGDGLLGGWRWGRLQAVGRGQARPRPGDPARIGFALAPRPVRRLAQGLLTLPPIGWLRPDAQREFSRVWRTRLVSEPRRWDRRLEWYSRWRFLELPVHSLGLIAADHRSQVVSPLADQRFIAALARDGGAAGFGNRSGVMRALFGDLLPEALIERRGKGEFGRAIWRDRARGFAARWDGRGVDGAMVDADRLRTAWRADNPVFGSALLLQAAWLASAEA